MKALTPVAVTSATGLPVSLESPSQAFRPQPRSVPICRFSCHVNADSGFQASPSTRRLAATRPPKQVRYPTDCLFAFNCSPPHLAVTQLLLATELWHSPTRTFTLLLIRLHGRTSAKLTFCTSQTSVWH